MPEHEAWNFSGRELWKLTVSWYVHEQRTPFKSLFSIQECLTWSNQTPSSLSESQNSGGWDRRILSSRPVTYTMNLRFALTTQWTPSSPFFKINLQTIGLKNSISNSLASPKMFGLITKFHNFTDKERENRVCMTTMLTIESNSRTRPAFDSCMSIFYPLNQCFHGILKLVNNTA